MLSKKIDSLPTKDRHLEDWSNTQTAWLAGFDTGLYEAAQLAKEADELILELMQTLEEVRDCNVNDKSVSLNVHKSVLEAIDSYKIWKEKINERD